eukprot:COSAG01_NODE_146_length_24099_cov_25.341208_5_plen_97_part_00
MRWAPSSPLCYQHPHPTKQQAYQFGPNNARVHSKRAKRHYLSESLRRFLPCARAHTRMHRAHVNDWQLLTHHMSNAGGGAQRGRPASRQAPCASPR